jgi:hypothetical protein
MFLYFAKSVSMAGEQPKQGKYKKVKASQTTVYSWKEGLPMHRQNWLHIAIVHELL